MLQLTQQSLAFQQEKTQLTEMLHAQHLQLEYLSEKTKTQEAAIEGWTEHAQQADQQVPLSCLQRLTACVRCWHAAQDTS